MTLKASEATAKSVRRSGEVCQELDIQPYVLKFWEAEFPQLSRRIGPKRLYGPEEFQIAEWIKRLLQDDGLTLAEAREALAGQLSRGELDAADVPSEESSAPSAISSSVVAAIVDDIEGSARAASMVEGGPGRAQLAQVIQERDAAEGREARARREVAELQSALVSVREELRGVRTELESTEKDRDQSVQRLEHATEELGAVRQKLEQAQAKMVKQQTNSRLIS
ncbi:MAG: MerR family transcriptional regulator [Acidobacteriota bacterium]